jgi:hypothetical protein
MAKNSFSACETAAGSSCCSQWLASGSSVVATAPSGIHYNKHVEGDGEIVFEHACRMGLEGIVSKHREHAYRSGRSKTWLKVKSPAAPGLPYRTATIFFLARTGTHADLFRQTARS